MHGFFVSWPLAADWRAAGMEKLCLAQAVTAQALVYRWAGEVESLLLVCSWNSLASFGERALWFP